MFSGCGRDDEDVPWQECKGIESSKLVMARAKAFLEWVMEREETVIAVVCHGFFICTLFSERAIQKMFEVSAEDLPFVKLNSAGNCSAHVVTLAI